MIAWIEGEAGIVKHTSAPMNSDMPDKSTKNDDDRDRRRPITMVYYCSYCRAHGLLPVDTVLSG